MKKLPQTIPLDHDATVKRLLEEMKQADRKAIASAFVASLGRRDLAARSALGSYAASLHFPLHHIDTSPKEATETGGHWCLICAAYNVPRMQEDLHQLDHERRAFGGLQHESPNYAWFDLHQFHQEPKFDPTLSDWAVLKAILDKARAMPVNAKHTDFAKSISNVVKSNANERMTLLSILGLTGILTPGGQIVFADRYPSYRERPMPTTRGTDWPYPIRWWRGSDGVRSDMVQRYFSHSPIALL